MNTDTGILYCWGKNKDHQLGFPGKMDAENIPMQVTFNRSDDLEHNKESCNGSLPWDRCCSQLSFSEDIYKEAFKRTKL